MHRQRRSQFEIHAHEEIQDPDLRRAQIRGLATLRNREESDRTWALAQSPTALCRSSRNDLRGTRNRVHGATGRTQLGNQDGDKSSTPRVRNRETRLPEAPAQSWWNGRGDHVNGAEH